MKKIYYYENPLTDDFAELKRDPIPIDSKYKYERGILWKFLSFILYRLIMTPIAYFYMKLKYRLKIKNKKVLKKHKREGYFLYGNHTNLIGDGFLPSLLCFPKKVEVLVCSENLSLKGTRNFMAMIGALPIPNRYSGMRSFKQAIHRHITKNHVIMIYPEGHVWPYYTKIRPFVSTSFSYPLTEGAPVYCFTVTYQKGWIRTHITAYVDGPFYASSVDDSKKQMEDLRNQVFEKMEERSKWSTFEKRIYRRKEDKK